MKLPTAIPEGRGTRKDLYHFFDRRTGPFRSLTSIPPEEAKAVILEIIGKYGLPQDWNNDGKHGPERYIEAHVWSDTPIAAYIAAYQDKEAL